MVSAGVFMNNRFTVNQKSLMTILASMQPMCTKRTALEATSSILFHIGHKELVLKATDLEISLQSSCQMEESTIEEPCCFLVPGRRIFELVKELDGMIEFQIDGPQLVLRAGSVNLSLHIKDAQEFPPFPETKTGSAAIHTAFFFTSPGSVYRITRSGTWGDATQATAEKGEKFLAWGVQSVLNLLEDVETTFARLPIR
jgi:hypothetical protein